MLNTCRTSLVWANKCYPGSLNRRNWLRSIVTNSLVVRQHTSPSLLLMVSLYSTRISPQSQARKHCQLESLFLYIPGPYLPVPEQLYSHRTGFKSQLKQFVKKPGLFRNLLFQITHVQTIWYTTLICAGTVKYSLMIWRAGGNKK